MNPYLQDILHNITTRLAKLEEAQSKKEWVGLTDEEVHQAYKNVLSQPIREQDKAVVFNVCRAIEAKLKEKNER
jgi:hypothetical protein